MRALSTTLCTAIILALSGCGDFVRYPGDGRRDIEPTPEGAPGPPPPSVPVDDPYGTGGDKDEPVNPLPEPEPEPEPEPQPDPEPEPLPIVFQYLPPGDLLPGSGTGTPDAIIYAPDITFPIEDSPTYVQSQVWRFGGRVMGGDQCDTRNFEYPWQDNFCETRSKSRNTPLCPLNKVHQGIDMRIGTPAECLQLRSLPPSERTLHKAVTVEAGLIEYIGPYWVRLRGESGTLYNYIHLNMAKLEVAELDTVSEGDLLGYVSNDFGGTPTTFHLHFEIKIPTEDASYIHAPPYMSLVEAYARREGGRGEEVASELVDIASVPILPDDFEIVE
ncbi:MAG: M23 family metallopeptidase [Pseudomonadota bacterium]